MRGRGIWTPISPASSRYPTETVNYLAAVTPNLGTQVPFSGPLANYAAATPGTYAGPPDAVNFATGCDVNAAYDPDHPCAATAPPPGSATPVVLAANDLGSAAGSCDLDTAYDPDNPCTPGPSSQAGVCSLNAAYDPDGPCSPAPAPVQPAVVPIGVAGACDLDAAYNPDRPCAPNPTIGAGSEVAMRTAPQSSVISNPRPQPFAGSASALYKSAAIPTQAAPAPAAVAAAPPPTEGPGVGNWAIQVGAFSTLGLARTVAEGARAQLPGDLAGADIALPATTPFGGLVLYRARLVHLSASEAMAACSALSQRQLPCVVLHGTAS